MTHQFSCHALECEFQVQADNQDTVITYGQKHAEESHDTELSDAEAEKIVEEF